MKTRKIEEIVGKILKKKDLTLSVAESCSGGLISNLITNVPGASDYFEGGIVSYSNRMKNKILNVPNRLLNKYGAVSDPVAKKMAEGVKKITGTDIGIGVTGIAGPSGGTKEKPVGLVYIAISTPQGTTVKKFNFHGKRIDIKKKVAHATFSLLLNALKGGVAVYEEQF